MSNALTEMTITQLVEKHNTLVAADAQIDKWKGRKDLLIEKVAEVLKATRGNKTIRSVSEALLIEVVRTEDGKPIGRSYDDVLEKVLAEFPDANTTVKCLRWYNTKLNSDTNVRMPVRPRKKVTKVEAPAPEVQAEAPVAEELVADPLA